MKSSCRTVAAGLLLLAGAACQAQILIGQTAGFSGAVAASVKETADGARLYLDAVNAKGGVGGLEVNFSAKDHTGLDFADLSIITSDGRFRR